MQNGSEIEFSNLVEEMILFDFCGNLLLNAADAKRGKTSASGQDWFSFEFCRIELVFAAQIVLQIKMKTISTMTLKLEKHFVHAE